MSFNFGTPTTTATSLSFGTPSASANTSTSGFSFGAPSAVPSATVQPQSTSFGFGASATPAKPLPGGFSFGTTPTTQAANSSFGFSTPNVQAVAPTVQTTNPPAFGSTQTAPTFGSAQAAPTFGSSIITPATQAPSLGMSFGTPGSSAISTTAPPSFNFGQPGSTTTTTAAPSLLTLGATTQTTSTLFSTPAQPLFSTAVPATQQQPGQQNPATTSAPPAFVGLGGIDMSASQQKAPEGKVEATKVKETQVPIQIMQSVEEFKNYIKNQKTTSSEITRSTDRNLKSVTDEIHRLNCAVQEASNTVDTNRSIIKHLRNETAKVIENADMAQRTHETPSGLQFENFLPQIYFKELIQRYEMDLLNLKHQVELTEKHLQSLTNPTNFTAQDLKKGLQQIHECFIALAGRVQDTHSKVEGQKDQYLQLRKFVLRDNTNVFETPEQDTAASANNRVQIGPNVFSNQGGFNFGNIQKPQQQTQQQPSAFNMTSMGGNTSTNLFGASSFGFNK